MNWSCIWQEEAVPKSYSISSALEGKAIFRGGERDVLNLSRLTESMCLQLNPLGMRTDRLHRSHQNFGEEGPAPAIICAQLGGGSLKKEMDQVPIQMGRAQ